jgi:hypothetical protein
MKPGFTKSKKKLAKKKRKASAVQAVAQESVAMGTATATRISCFARSLRPSPDSSLFSKTLDHDHGYEVLFACVFLLQPSVLQMWTKVTQNQ